jgi:hypothetical protein
MHPHIKRKDRLVTFTREILEQLLANDGHRGILSDEKATHVLERLAKLKILSPFFLAGWPVPSDPTGSPVNCCIQGKSRFQN